MILYQNSEYIVEQSLLGYKFKVTSRNLGRTTKSSGILQDNTAQAWHLIRTSKIADRSVAQEAEAALFSLLADAAFDPGGKAFQFLTSRIPQEISIELLKRSAQAITGSLPPIPDWQTLFEDDALVLDVNEAGKLRIRVKRTDRKVVATIHELSQFIAVMGLVSTGRPEVADKSKYLWKRTFSRALAEGTTSNLYQMVIGQPPEMVAAMIASAP